MSGNRIRAVFRKDRHCGDVLAFLPDMEANEGNIMSYGHNGQHGEATYSYYLDECDGCSEEEFGDLKHEIEDLCHCDVEVVDAVSKEDVLKIWKWKWDGRKRDGK